MRMSKPQRDRMYPLVLRREVILGLPLMNVGPYCRICGIEVQKDRGGPLPQGIIDDITNSGDHSDLRNLQLLCRPCNTAKNYRPKDPDNRRTMTTSEQTNERERAPLPWPHAYLSGRSWRGMRTQRNGGLWGRDVQGLACVHCTDTCTSSARPPAPCICIQKAW